MGKLSPKKIQNQKIHHQSAWNSVQWKKLALDAQYVGDDFLLAISTLEKDLSPERSKFIVLLLVFFCFSLNIINLSFFLCSKDDGVVQRGLCMSGLTIERAVDLIKNMPVFKASKLIINIGSVDILHGTPLIDMCYHFKHLVAVCKKRAIEPILTTLAPLANINHSTEIRDKLLSYNNFICDNFINKCLIIDIWSAMISPTSSTLFELFEM